MDAKIRIKDRAELASQANVEETHFFVVDDDNGVRKLTLTTLRAAIARGLHGVKEVDTTTYTVLDSDNDTLLAFTHASGCAVTIPDTLPDGFRASFLQASDTVTFGTTGSIGIVVLDEYEGSPAATREGGAKVDLHVALVPGVGLVAKLSEELLRAADFADQIGVLPSSLTLAELNTAVSDANVMAVGAAPTAHAASHAVGGGDTVTPAQIQAMPRDLVVSLIAGNTYGPAAGDRNTLFWFTANNGCEVTIPDGTLSDGWRIWLGQGHAAGRVRVVAGGSGVIVQGSPSETGGIGQILEVFVRESTSPAQIVVRGVRTDVHAHIDDGDSPYTLLPAVSVLHVDSSGGDVEIRMPAASPANLVGYGTHSCDIVQTGGAEDTIIELTRGDSELINGVDAGSLTLLGSNAPVSPGERRGWRVTVDPAANGGDGVIEATSFSSPVDTPIKTVTTDTYELLSTDRDKILIFTHASGCTVTVPSTGLPIGWSVALQQGGANPVVLDDDGGATVIGALSVYEDPPETAEASALIVITVEATGPTAVKVYGELAIA